MAKEKGRRIVASADAAALAAGIRPGQPVALATAAVPGLVLLDAAPEADAAALDRLATWCLRYGPVVQASPPDGIWLDVEGASHLQGGEEALVADLLARLARAGLAAQAALAGTPGAAHALARHRPCTIVPPGRDADALAPLPVGALRLPAETERGLVLLGIDRIGDLDRLPRSSLALRFGTDLTRPWDQAFGRVSEPLRPLVPATVPQLRKPFAEPVGHLDGLSAALDQMLPELCRELARRGAGLRRLDALFRRVDGRPIGIRIGTAAPSRDPTHLARLLRERLPVVDPGFGIDEIVLAASRSEPLAERQAAATLDPDASADDPARLAPLVDRLAIRVGSGRVFRIAPVESRVPERSWRRVGALSPAARASWPPALPRPSRIIDPPEPIHAVAVVPDDPPAFFVWRRVRHQVRSADGPERVRGEWWLSDGEAASLRDYYRVEDTEGRRFWLFRDAPMAEGGAWWLHGRFA